ncbi:acetyl-CoA carboxylase carboxyltransferase subunit alpha [Myxococcota bacterium]|nr:acetyl-CoA carboxylase carboxyltransferase subunit alpha [Myxococcota bacterium]
MDLILDFERPLMELRRRIESLKALQAEEGLDLSASIEQLDLQARRLQGQMLRDLSPWQRTLLSRHPQRPYSLDWISRLFTDWRELHGDRAGHDDAAIVGGFARYKGRPVAVLGHQKGRNTKESLKRNFGMPRPEGYRKALRLMSLAARFGRPIITLIDTPGAYPGVDAEARGQAEAIARNIMEMSTFQVPVICVVIGEGGSGGALALGVGNRTLMLENSTYSVISPEGCAAILWRDRAEGPRAAEALRITAKDCLNLGVADEVVTEPGSGAHRDPDGAAAALDAALERHLNELSQLDGPALREDRYARYRKLGVVLEEAERLASMRAKLAEKAAREEAG